MSFRRIKIIIGVTSALLLTGCAQSIQNPQQQSMIPAFSNASNTHPINRIRLNAVRDTAQTVGAQAGLAWGATHYNKILSIQSRTLYRAYNFQGLMLNNDVLPPVLEESSNSLNLASNSAIRLSDRIYKILKPARFVTAVPSWRDYLWMNYTKPEAPDASLMPKSNQERSLWNKYIQIGWKSGLKQAKAIYAININRLTRDYQGMILYHKLLAQHIVSPPYVSRSELGITGDNNNLRVNDRVLRITSMAKFKANSKYWKARIRTKYRIYHKKRRTRVKRKIIRAYG